MGLRERLQQPELREQIFRCLLAVGTFAALPYPDESHATLLNIMLISEWALTGVWAWSIVFSPEMSRTFWVANLILSLVLFLKLKLVLHPLLLVLWALWNQVRDLRLARQKTKTVLQLIFLSVAIFKIAPSRAQGQISDDELRKMEQEMDATAEPLVSKPVAKKKKKPVPPPKKAATEESDESLKPTATKKLPVQTLSEKTPEVEKEEVKEAPKPETKDENKTAAPQAIEPLEPPERPKLSEDEKIEVPDLKPATAPVGKNKAKKKSNATKKGKIDPKKFDEFDDLSHLTKSEKDAVIGTLPKPSEVRREQEAEKNKDFKLTELPKYLTGYGIVDYSSCTVYDRIPWKFSPDRRKKRLILRDKLRHQLETTFKTWEVYQVMDGDGYVSYVFRNALPDGRYDSIVVKDTIYNRFVETPRGKKQTEFQDLRGLVNRPAIAFYGSDGGSISLLPSSIGRSALVIQQGKADGRLMPPIYLRGNTCDRPDDDEDSDQKAKENVSGDRPPTVKK